MDKADATPVAAVAMANADRLGFAPPAEDANALRSIREVSLST